MTVMHVSLLARNKVLAQESRVKALFKLKQHDKDFENTKLTIGIFQHLVDNSWFIFTYSHFF